MDWNESRLSGLTLEDVILIRKRRAFEVWWRDACGGSLRRHREWFSRWTFQANLRRYEVSLELDTLRVKLYEWLLIDDLGC